MMGFTATLIIKIILQRKVIKNFFNLICDQKLYTHNKCRNIQRLLCKGLKFARGLRGIKDDEILKLDSHVVYER